MSLFGRRQPDSSRPRSSEEREQARREREARRAAREGRPQPPPPALADDDPFGDAAPPAERSGRFTSAPDAFLGDEPRAVEQRGEPPFEPVVDEPLAPQHDDPPAFGDDERLAPGHDDPPAFGDDELFAAGHDDPPAFGDDEPFAAGHDDALEPDEPRSAALPAEDTPRAHEEPRASGLPTDAAPPASPFWDTPSKGAAPPDEALPDPLAPSARRPADPPPAADPAPRGDASPATGDWLADPPAPHEDASSATGGWLADSPAPPDDAPAADPAPREDDPFGLAPAADPGATQPFTPVHEPAEEQPISSLDQATVEFTPDTSLPSPPRATTRPQPPPKPTYGDEHERPVPVRRLANKERKLPPPPPPPGEKPARRGRPRRGRVLGILALLLIAGLAWLAFAVFQPFHGEGGDPVTVRIPQNSTANEVGDLLAEKGVVNSAFVFTLRARLSGANLQAGTYRLPSDSSYSDAIDALEAGPPPARVINLTIPEGRSRREAAPLIEEAGVAGNYLQASEKPTSGFSPRRYGAPRGLRSMEGFLFPATYELKPNATARQLVARQLDAFRENVAKVSMRRARNRNLSTYDVLTIASMVEREASLAKERPLIAAVIHNRLKEGMPLGIDATIRFATRNWSRPLRQSELNIDSPYNTRRRTGLPPGPIGSPGLSSIRAAANPANVDYLFYVVKPCGKGAHNFSATDAEFQKDVEAYNREREKRGGKSPVNC